MSSHLPTINLLSKPEFQLTTLGRVSNWALTVGRWIVVVTELIVIAAFIWRFSLDQEIATLKSEIEEKRNILLAAQPQENQFRQVQKRLQVLNKVLDQQHNLDSLFQQLNQSLPEGLALNSIYLDQESRLRLKGTSQTEDSISNLIANMRQSSLFRNVQLEQVNLETSKPGTPEQFLFNVSSEMSPRW